MSSEEAPGRASPDFFKGWAIPGPRPSAPQGSGKESPSVGETLDALSGFYKIFQAAKGHRFSTDDIVTAWYGTSGCPSAARVLDLGSGIGTVAMIAAWRLLGATVVSIEAQDLSVALAEKSRKYNALEKRWEIRHADFRAPGVLEENEIFDLILGTPPYFPIGSGLTGDHPQKEACRFELRGDISDYCRVASAHLGAGGFFASIFPLQPEQQLKRVEEGAQAAGLTIIRKRPLILREGEAPLLSLFGMMRSDHLPEKFRGNTWEEPPLTIRLRNGEIHPEYSVIKLSIGFPP